MGQSSERSPSMLLRNAWYIAAWADELGMQPVARRICNEPIVLFRDSQNRAAALTNRCCHRAAPLHLGTITEAGLQCGYHGLVFDGSGHCVAIPGQSRIPEDARVRSYPVVEKNQLVWVWLGEAAKADPSLIVDFPYHDDKAKWPNKHDMYPIKGNYMLTADMKTTRTPNGLKFTRWMKNSAPPPSYVKAAGFQGRVDRCQIFEFVAPSTVLQWTGAADAGSDYTDPQRDFRFQFRLFHGLTPETETSCYYFWSVANGYRQNEPEATEQLYREIAPTFVEDKDMVEAQQARLDELGEQGLVNIVSDTNRVVMRRFIERLLADEKGALAAE